MPIDVLALLDNTSEGLAWTSFLGYQLFPVVDTTPDSEEPNEEDPGVATPLLLWSGRESRELAVRLDGRTVSGPMAVFVSEQGVRSVAFSIDGVFERTESAAPYDLKGGVGALAVMWAPEPGIHTVTAVVAFTDVSREPETLTAVFDVEAEQVPSNPTLTKPVLSALPGEEIVSLSWDAIPGAARYVVRRSGVIVSPTNLALTMYFDNQVAGGLAYTYTVAAADATGEGPQSDPVTVTPTASQTGDQIPGQFRPTATNVGHGTGGRTAALEPMSGGTFPAGTVIQNKRISGGVNFSGSGGKLINCEVNYSGVGSAVTTNADTITGIVIERCTINAPNGVGISTRNGSIVRFTRITAGKDGIKAWHDSLYEALYVKMKRPAGSSVHLDAVQGSGKTRWITRGCWLEVNHTEGGNFAWFCQSFNGTIQKVCADVLCELNWLLGGNKAIATENGKPGATGQWLFNIVIRNNQVAHQGRYYPNVAQYNGSEGSGDVRRSNNVWMTDGPAGAAGTSI